MKSGKSSVLESSNSAREAALGRGVLHGQRFTGSRAESSERWCLPSGAGLAEFAMQSGIPASRLWEESRTRTGVVEAVEEVR